MTIMICRSRIVPLVLFAAACAPQQRADTMAPSLAPEGATPNDPSADLPPQNPEKVALQADRSPLEADSLAPSPVNETAPDTCADGESENICPPAGMYLMDARVIDGSGAPPRTGIDLHIVGGRIVEMAPDLEPPTGASVTDLSGATVVPGLIDSHVHILGSPAAGHAHRVMRAVTETTADKALRATVYARKTLEAGFTTVRSVGGGPGDRALRDAIAAGHVEGPRVLIAHNAIGITGGHCDGTTSLRGPLVNADPDVRAGIADGEDQARSAVRHQIKLGADVIKICATGGVMSQGRASQSAQLTDVELSAIVSEAHRAGVPVAAHAHGLAGIRAAVVAGVDSIEHGTFLDPKVARLMARKGTFLVPTLYVGQWVLQQADLGHLSPVTARKAREVAPRMLKSLSTAISQGVKVAFGTDAGVFDHGENAREFALMVKAGMTPMQTIVAATTNAAELLGVEAELGRLARGYAADLVVYGDDPLADVRVLERPQRVMKGGRWVFERDEAEMTPETPVQVSAAHSATGH